MTEITLYYAPRLLARWKQSRLHRDWYGQYKKGYSDRDLANADNQCRYGWGFAECFATRYFRRRGYEVLTSKYLHPTRSGKQYKARQILGEAHTAFLMRRRRFGGTKTRRSPYPDLLVFTPNRKKFFFAEVKRDTDRLSKAQRLFFRMIKEKLGLDVWIVHLKARESQDTNGENLRPRYSSGSAMRTKNRGVKTANRRAKHPFLSNLVSPLEIRVSSGRRILIPRCTYRFERWRGKRIADTYGGKSVLRFGSRPVFAELAILRILQQAGWDGVWVDSYRRKLRRDLAPHHCKLPLHAEALYYRICSANRGMTGGWFDVFAWKGNKYLFVESKRKGKDHIQESQLNWVRAALKSGVPLGSLLVVEWSLRG